MKYLNLSIENSSNISIDFLLIFGLFLIGQKYMHVYRENVPLNSYVMLNIYSLSLCLKKTINIYAK